MQRVIVCSVILAIFAGQQALAQTNATCPLALTRWVVRRNESRQIVEAAVNADGSYNASNITPNGPGLNVFPSVSLARVTLQPCGVRTMHTHSNVDEVLYVLSGQVGASTVYASGAVCEQAILNPGDSYVYPRNLVHSARNPSCNVSTTYIAFFTAFDSATINIASSAYAIPGSPFKSYANPRYNASLNAAISPSTLAFDADCLARCRLGTQGGQLPADNDSSRKRRLVSVH